MKTKTEARNVYTKEQVTALLQAVREEEIQMYWQIC